MLFKLHYFCLSAGSNAMNILLGVYMATYSDATPTEIGLLYMLMPFIGLIFRPILCSMADRRQAHREYLIVCELMTALSFAPFIIIPYLGDEFHKNYPRFCWYCLALFRIAGDIVFGGAISIGDALAINYATRIGTEYIIYRVWASIAWMTFGMITGHLNEIWFLPKYVAGFMILVLASLIDALACYLWPKEYFVMVTASTMKKENEQHQLEQESKGNKLGSQFTRSLMPREVVWAHAKKQIWSLVTCSCYYSAQSMNKKNEDLKMMAADEQVVVAKHATISNVRPDSELANQSKTDKSPAHKEDDRSIDKRTQLQTLFLLLRRDPRVVGYLLVFIGSGSVLAPINFFFMSLSDICHARNICNFSELGGYLQFMMSFVETLIFLRIKTIILKVGRLNSLTIAFGLSALKYLFYGTIWQDVNPYWSLIPESLTGLIFATFLTLMVEMGHLFATEVEHLIPELVQRGIIRSDDEASREKLKLSLAATMQGLTASANDGLGRGMGALIYGLIIDAYSYQTLWLVICITSTSMVVVVQMANLLESCYNVNAGLDVGAANTGAAPDHFDSNQQQEDLEMQIVRGSKTTT